MFKGSCVISHAICYSSNVLLVSTSRKKAGKMHLESYIKLSNQHTEENMAVNSNTLTTEETVSVPLHRILHINQSHSPAYWSDLPLIPYSWHQCTLYIPDYFYLLFVQFCNVHDHNSKCFSQWALFVRTFTQEIWYSWKFCKFWRTFDSYSCSWVCVNSHLKRLTNVKIDLNSNSRIWMHTQFYSTCIYGLCYKV